MVTRGRGAGREGGVRGGQIFGGGRKFNLGGEHTMTIRMMYY